MIWKFCTQIVLALKECHRHKENGVLKPILHRDIKPGNILLDQHRNIKLADFGLAKELASQSKFARTNVGTPFYMSPEMINSAKYVCQCAGRRSFAQVSRDGRSQVQREERYLGSRVPAVRAGSTSVCCM